MISLQMGPQTRMLQNNDTLMIEKIQSSWSHHPPLEEPDGSDPGTEHARRPPPPNRRYRR